MENIKNNTEICENIINIINYEQYEDLGKDYYELGNYANNDDCSKALELTVKNYLTFSAILELNPDIILSDNFKSMYEQIVDYYFHEYVEDDTPLYNQGIMTKAFYLSNFFNDLKKINLIRQEKNVNHKERSRAKLLKSEILYLTCCDYYFDYFVGAYIAKLMLHLQVESIEEYNNCRKYIESSINNKNHEFLEFILYRIDNREEAISDSFDANFGEKIIDDAIVEMELLQTFKDYVTNAQDIAAVTEENEESSSVSKKQKNLVIKMFKSKKSS